VLHVQEGEVAAGPGQDMADAGRDEFHEEGAGREVSRTNHLLQ
jgi:hypothetical protein